MRLLRVLVDRALPPLKYSIALASNIAPTFRADSASCAGGRLGSMTLPDKPTSRLQRYRLTEAGQAWCHHSRATTHEERRLAASATRVIARVFRELGLTEQWGSRASSTIFDPPHNKALPKPLIEEIPTGIRLRIWLAPPPARPGQTPAPAGDTSSPATG